MKLIISGFWLVVLSMVLLLSCSNKAEEPSLEPLHKSEISGNAIWNRITVESNFKNYTEWPKDSDLQPGQSPHGVWHRVFANRTLLEALPAVDSTAPEGSLIVKENFDSSKTLGSITVMAKVKGYDPENGDWYWAMFDPEGKVLKEGSPGGCISCHAGMRSNDFVIINPLDMAP